MELLLILYKFAAFNLFVLIKILDFTTSFPAVISITTYFTLLYHLYLLNYSFTLKYNILHSNIIFYFLPIITITYYFTLIYKILYFYKQKFYKKSIISLIYINFLFSIYMINKNVISSFLFLL
mgnify:CR=1 FL=1